MKHSNFRLTYGLVGLLLLVPVSAWASRGGEGNNTGCNGVGNAYSPCAGNGGNGGNGGAGGQGGQGGRGGVGIGVGISAAQATAAARARASSNATARGGEASASAEGGRGGDANVRVDVQGGGGSGGTTTYREQRQVPGFAMGFMMPPQCGVSFSGGGNNVNGTGALGFSFETESCRKHRLASALSSLGETAGAVALLCSMSEISEAMMQAGRPCPGTNAPSATVAPAVVPASVQPSAPVARQIPDWCLTASPSERRRHAVCNG